MPEAKPVFRRSLEGDVDAVYAVIEQARARIASLGIDQWQNGRPNRDAVAGDVARGEGYVMERDGEIVATAMLTPSGERIYDSIEGAGWISSSTSDDPAYLTVHRFAVSDRACGKGCAKAMLGHAEELARDAGMKSVRIDTHEGNAPMRGLLSKCGYAECGTVLLDVEYDEPTLERIGYEKLV